MSHRPHKRLRTRIAIEGGHNQTFIPLHTDTYLDVHSRDGHLRKLGSLITPAVVSRLVSTTNTNWSVMTEWAPPDDPEFALDPDGAQYDEVLISDVLKGDENTGPSLESAKKKKKNRSKVSRRPHIIWKEQHRQSYLDEIIHWAGRGDFQKATECPDCLSRKEAEPNMAEYRCRECFIPDLCCKNCCVRRHRMHPLHRIEFWNGKAFEKRTLKSMGLKIQLNHGSLHCENPVACHSSMLVLHVNGIHEVAFNYCNCSRALPQHIQLLRRGFFPASQLIVKTCATFELLEVLHKFALTTKSSTYDFYRALEKLTDNTGVRTPKTRYRSLFRIIMQWRHLGLLKRGGRAHAPTGIDGTQAGELALRCPSCPHPGINLPDEWESVPVASRFLYTMFICMDANFRLKNQLVSSYSQDPGYGIGWAYMVPREPYEKFITSRTNDQDISTCVGFQALAQANTRFSRGLRTTGVGGAFCSRSEMILPLGIGNLQKGERYANMDYIFASVLRLVMIQLILISYDIACQWIKNLFTRMSDNWPDELKLRPNTRIIPAIPKLHEHMHETAGHQVFSLNCIPGVGLSDAEASERIWSAHNALGNSTKTQGPGSRQDVLDDHFSFWNWQKYMGLGKTLARKYRAAVADRNVQTEAHRSLTASLENHLTAKWEAMCLAWEADEYPKNKKNPYETPNATITEAQAKKELAAEEEKRLAEGGVALHGTSASSFISLGLEIEESQRRVARLAAGVTSNATARQEGGLLEQRNQLTARIRTWEQLLPVYMPGLLQYRSKLRENGTDADSVPGQPENVPLYLPSLIPQEHRSSVCIVKLDEIEDRLRTAQCYDALANLRHILKIKSRLVMFKNKNVRGQREGTRSRAIIDRVHEKARVAAAKYRSARVAKFNLSGPGAWEEELRVLQDSDVRGYQDPNKLRERQARRGTLEDEQLTLDPAEAQPASQTDDFTLFREERTRRDGTGETRRTLSWIWRVSGVADDPSNATDEILRVEWAKSRAREARATEEVQLLREEMRRTLKYLEWRANWWISRIGQRTASGSLAEGLSAYASSQASVQSSLAAHFRELWKNPLQDLHSTSSAPVDQSGNVPPAPSGSTSSALDVSGSETGGSAMAIDVAQESGQDGEEEEEDEDEQGEDFAYEGEEDVGDVGDVGDVDDGWDGIVN
ncbi:hypothetical protein CVT26_014500 [Gymnopilus dilepis]|uniref:CxC2-like cysteine cluster KDZ transposase-associated domain-containing protein n=1 Tax=Gymnopilus dilepis TaxID=231916 RepID=A0A409WS97_9AGAR|nr:hypothetical protein CVT26_014500 [Gymnopilus dilepis]